MQRFRRFPLRPVPVLLVVCVILVAGQCVAQEVDVPGRGRGSILLPTGWVELITPVHERVDLRFYGFFIGNVNAPSAQFDATFKPTKFFSITPSYLYYLVPASGINKVANITPVFTQSFEEHQFRIDGTVGFSIRKLEISDRNMYVRRFLPNTAINRYRNRVAFAYPLKTKGHPWKPFGMYEAFYDQGSGWTKNRIWTGVTFPVQKHVSFQPSYMWESTQRLPDLHYVMFGLIVNTKSK